MHNGAQLEDPHKGSGDPAPTFDCTSDKRVENNGTMHQCRVLSEQEKRDMHTLMDLGEQFLNKCKELGSSQELTLAQDKAYEAVFWACKHVTINKE